MRVAAVDCGTNSLRLLVADLDADSGVAVPLERRTTIVRLGQDVDRTGVFAEAALRRTFAALDEFAELVAAHDVAATRLVATSAARDVANRDAFLDGVRVRLGVDADIVSGDEEAELSYDGATRGLRGAAAAAPVVVVDIGGGSTELVTLTSAGTVVGQSLDIGSVRMTERHLHSDPPERDQILAARADIDVALDRLDLPLDHVGTLVGVAGTTLTMVAMVLRQPAYDRDLLHHTRVATTDVLEAVDAVVAMSVEQRRALPFMHHDRADVIGGGALVLGQVVRRLAVDSLLPSAHDILDGIAWSLLPRAGAS